MVKDKLLVSIIIPFYNDTKYLTVLISSIKKYSFRHFECLLINDGSSEKIDILEKIIKRDSRFILINQENQGVSGARNTGIKMSRGKYVQFVDADDLLSTNKINSAVKIMEINPSIDVVLSDYFIYSGKNKTRNKYKYISPLDELVIHNFIVINSALIRKCSVKDTNWFNEKIKAMEDWHFWLKLALNKVTFFVDGNINSYAIVRNRPDSLSKNYQKMFTGHSYIRKWLTKNLTDRNLKQTNYFRNKTAEYLYGIYKIKNNKILDGTISIIKSFPFVITETILTGFSKQIHDSC